MKMQMTRISILQSSKILTLFYFLIGFVYWLMAIPMLIFGDHRMRFIGIGYLLMPVIMAVFGFIGFVTFAAIYNLLTGWLGGIEFEIKTIDSEPRTLEIGEPTNPELG